MNKVALLFPGQGTQYVGMGKDVLNNLENGQHIFEEANDILGFNLRKLCLEGPIEELTNTINAQSAILTVSYLTYKLFLNMFELKPSFSAGHSLGEYTALLCSEALSFSDCLSIVRKRGEFMQEASQEQMGGMLAIRNISREQIEEVCSSVSIEDEVVVVSNYNSPSQIVISGHSNAIERASMRLQNMNAHYQKLNVSAPFHSPIMGTASKKLGQELLKYKYNQPKYPVISNVDGRPYENNKTIISKLTRQLTEPVRWTESMDYIVNQQVNIAIELGPRQVLKNLLKQNTDKIIGYSLNNKEDIRQLKEAMKFKDSDTTVKYKSIITKCLCMAVCTKNNNWNNDEYNEGVIKPYSRIQEIMKKIESEDTIPSNEEIREALELLKIIFNTKKVPIDEQEERFNKILDNDEIREQYKDIVQIQLQYNY